MLKFSVQTKKDLHKIVREFCKEERIPKTDAHPKASVEAALEGDYSFVVYDALGCDDLSLRIKDGVVVNEELEALYQDFKNHSFMDTYGYVYETV